MLLLLEKNAMKHYVLGCWRRSYSEIKITIKMLNHDGVAYFIERTISVQLNQCRQVWMLRSRAELMQ